MALYEEFKKDFKIKTPEQLVKELQQKRKKMLRIFRSINWFFAAAATVGYVSWILFPVFKESYILRLFIGFGYGTAWIGALVHFTTCDKRYWKDLDANIKLDYENTLLQAENQLLKTENDIYKKKIGLPPLKQEEVKTLKH